MPETNNTEKKPRITQEADGSHILDLGDVQHKVGDRFPLGEKGKEVLFVGVSGLKARFFVYLEGAEDDNIDYRIELELPIDNLTDLEAKVEACIDGESEPSLSEAGQTIFNAVAERLDHINLDPEVSFKIKKELYVFALKIETKDEAAGNVFTEQDLVAELEKQIKKIEKVERFESVRSSAYMGGIAQVTPEGTLEKDGDTKLPMSNIEIGMNQGIVDTLSDVHNLERKTDKFLAAMDAQYDKDGTRELLTTPGTVGEERSAERDAQMKAQRVNPLTTAEQLRVKMKIAQLSETNMTDIASMRINGEAEIKRLEQEFFSPEATAAREGVEGARAAFQEDIAFMRADLEEYLERAILRAQADEVFDIRAEAQNIGAELIDRHEKRYNLFQRRHVPENFDSLPKAEQQAFIDSLPADQKVIREKLFQAQKQRTARGGKPGTVASIPEQIKHIRNIQDDINERRAVAEVQGRESSAELDLKVQQADAAVRKAKDKLQEADGAAAKAAARAELATAKSVLKAEKAKTSLGDEVSDKVMRPEFDKIANEAGRAVSCVPQVFGLGGETVEQTHKRLLEGKEALLAIIKEQYKDGKVAEKELKLLAEQEAAIKGFEHATMRLNAKKEFEREYDSRDTVDKVLGAIPHASRWLLGSYLELSSGLDARNDLLYARAANAIEGWDQPGFVKKGGKLVAGGLIKAPKMGRFVAHATVGLGLYVTAKIADTALNWVRKQITKYTGFDLGNWVKSWWK